MDSLLLAILIPALFIASFCDFYWHLIPNFITLPLIVTGLVINTMVFGVDGFLNATKGLGIGFVCFIIFYLLGAMGAGDVKLVAGIGALIGGDKIALVLLSIALTGGLIAIMQLVITIWQMYVSPLFLPQGKILPQGKRSEAKMSQSTSGVKSLPLKFAVSMMSLKMGLKKTLPYGIAISIGTFITFLI
jgi:Flp pilus assembly protein protease CpaA